MTARELIDQLQAHIAKWPMAADWPVMFESPLWLGEGKQSNVERVVLDLRLAEQHFWLDGVGE